MLGKIANWSRALSRARKHHELVVEKTQPVPATPVLDDPLSRLQWKDPAAWAALTALRERVLQLEAECIAKPFAPSWAAYRHGVEAGKQAVLDNTALLFPDYKVEIKCPRCKHVL